jgi:hypothetical protein
MRTFGPQKIKQQEEGDRQNEALHSSCSSSEAAVVIDYIYLFICYWICVHNPIMASSVEK